MDHRSACAERRSTRQHASVGWSGREGGLDATAWLCGTHRTLPCSSQASACPVACPPRQSSPLKPRLSAPRRMPRARRSQRRSSWTVSRCTALSRQSDTCVSRQRAGQHGDRVKGREEDEDGRERVNDQHDRVVATPGSAPVGHSLGDTAGTASRCPLGGTRRALVAVVGAPLSSRRAMSIPPRALSRSPLSL